MAMIDCLLVGHNDTDFANQVASVRATGETSGAWRDLNLAFIDIDGKPYRSMDVLNRCAERISDRQVRRFSNLDFLWPVITYLGTFLSKNGLTVEFFNLYQDGRDKLARVLAEQDVLTIAVTTTLYVSAQPLVEVVEFLRRHKRDAKIIVGGPFIHNQARMSDIPNLLETLEFINADIYVISQEGESALANIIRALKSGSPLETIANIAYREGSSFRLTAQSTETNDLASNMVDYA